MPSDPSALGARRTVRIGKYEVIAHIATGGMGAVYRAKDTESGQEIALKVLTAEMAAKPAMLERFRREGRNAAKLKHENIVNVHESSEFQGTYYIAMEYVDGIDLHDYIEQKGQLDPEESRQIMIQAARALAHAHTQGIVHRDIKPSNFLLTRKGSRLIVKLTDLGLAREVHNEEFRVTRAGTTVGTVDYIAPEQARDSSNADTRSDMYSLGCTWFHMLTGQTPFCKGGLAERLIKHMESPPPDVRDFNPRVSDELVKVLTRLLAKDPNDRYQEPRELVQALLEMNPVRAPGKEDEEAIAPSRGKGKRGSGKRSSGAQAKRSDETKKARRGRQPLPWIAGVVIAVVLVGCFLVVYLHNRSKPRPPGEATEVPQPDPTPVVPVRDSTKPPDPIRPPDPITPKDAGTVQPPPPPIKPRYAALYTPRVPIPVEKLRRELEAGWAEREKVPADAGVLRVGRLADAGQPGGGGYTTVASAIAAAPQGKTTVIEIHDNGPLYETAAVAADRSIVLRAGKGYRPLIVWDVQQAAEERKKAGGAADTPQALLTVHRGLLRAEGLDFVVRWPETVPARADAWLRVQDGDLAVKGCTFSVAGKHAEGLRLASFTSTRTEPGHCRFAHCYARGGSLAGLELDAPGAEVALEQCLWTGGQAPLLQVRAAATRPATVRVAQSTLIAGRTLVRIQNAAEPEPSPAFRWVGWDALLCRSSSEGDGELLRLPPQATTRNITWEAYNCLCAGWPVLLTGGVSRISSADPAAWQRTWGRVEGEMVLAVTWPQPAYMDTEEKPAGVYRTLDTTVGFASSTSSDLPLGCQLETLPPSRDSWLTLTFDRLTPSVVAPGELGQPQIPVSTDGNYTGERLDLNAKPPVDVGIHLQKIQASGRALGKKVVMILAGSGEKISSPIVVKPGVSLSLYAEPPVGEAAPLALKFKTQDLNRPEAFLDVPGGSLDVQNLELRTPEGAFATQAASLVRVAGGDLRLTRCRLQTPLLAAAGFRTLLTFQGSGSEDPARVRTCVLTDSVLVSREGAVQLQGIGTRLAVQRCVVAAGQTAFHFHPAGLKTQAAVQATLDQVTVAARGAVFGVEAPGQDAGGTANLAHDPILIQTRECAFLSPFPKGSRSGLLQVSGPALARGLVLWQSEDDAFDARLHFGVAAAGDLPEQAQPSAQWLRLLGSPAVRRPFLDVAVRGTFDAKTWALDQLALPRLPGAGERRPGADLAALGLLKKPR